MYRNPQELLRGCLAVLFVVANFSGFSPVANGDLIRWNNPASGIFSAGPNWFGGITPGADDTAIIDVQDVNQPDYTVTVDTPTTVGGLNVSTITGGLRIPNVTFNVTGQASLGTGPVRAVNSNTTFGSLVNATDLILQAADGSNTFTVNGNASNTNNLLFRVDRTASNSFLQTTANFNGGLTNSNIIAFETTGGGSVSGTLNVGGVFDNNSQIVNRSSGTFQIGADTFNNNGTITSLQDAFVSFSRSGGAINNVGTISARMNAGFLSSFHNQGTGVIDSTFMQINAGGLGSNFTNDGSINMPGGSFNTGSFETTLNRSTISANSVSMTAGFSSSTWTNEGTIFSNGNTTISAGTIAPKAGSTLSGSGALSLTTTTLDMESGFAPGFSNVTLVPGNGSQEARVSGTGVFEAHNITMEKWITFNAGTSLDFSGEAIFRVFNSNSSSTALTLNAPLVIDQGERFRLQGNRGFSRAIFNQGLINHGEYWVETTRPFSSGTNPSIVTVVRQGLTNSGKIISRPRSGFPYLFRRFIVSGAFDNSGEIVNLDNGTPLEFQASGVTFNNQGQVNATGGDIIFSFINTFQNNGTVHTNAGRTVTITRNTSTFVNDIDGVISGHGTLVTEGAFIDNGTIAPGSSPGIMTIETPNYTQGVDGVIELEIFGLTPGSEHDQLIINSPNAQLNGVLRLIFREDFLPEQGQEFDLIVGPATTNFHTVELVNLAGGFMFDLASNNGTLSLTALNDARFEIPEPSTCLLVSLAAVLVFVGRRFV